MGHFDSSQLTNLSCLTIICNAKSIVKLEFRGRMFETPSAYNLLSLFVYFVFILCTHIILNFTCLWEEWDGRG